MNKTGYIFHPQYLKHDTKSHPENSGRLKAIQDKIESSKIYSHLHFPEPRRATDDELAANHDMGHIDDVRNSCRSGVQNLYGDTVICPDSWDAATLSAGAGLTAIDQIITGQLDNAFTAVRPPGHHAARDMFGGYCFLNNAAIAAQYLRDQGAERVAILDVDFHHGNGTQAIFYERSDVFFSSIHGDPVEAFPHFLGHAHETGQGEGQGYNLNHPLPAGTG